MLIVFAMSAVISLRSSAGDERPSVKRPVVLVIGVGVTEEARAREQRFVTNLGLNIDGFVIRRIPPPMEDFAKSSLDRQIERLKPLMESFDVAAAMWLSAVSEEMLLLQVVVLDTGRALVRLFEGELEEGSEAKLALTAGELLGTAYMFEPMDLKRPPEIQQLVVQTRDQAGVKAVPAPKWRAYLMGLGRTGVVGGDGPRTRVGGTAGAERTLLEWFALRIGLGAAFGPFGAFDDLELSGYEIWAELNAVFGLTIRRVRIGPVLRILGGPSSVVVEDAALGKSDYNLWNIYGALGIELAISISESVSFNTSVGIEATPLQLSVERRSNAEVIQANAFMGVFGSVGLLLF